jgi:hypothetical protein
VALAFAAHTAAWARAPATCRPAPAFAEAARLNTASYTTLGWAPFGREETGWAVYAPLIAHEIGADDCSALSTAFAKALAGWQAAHGLPPDGVVTPDSFVLMREAWEERRPFLNLRRTGVCPDAPSDAALAAIAPAESYEGKDIRLRTGALAAYRALVTAAFKETPALRNEPKALTIFSGFRSPASDAERCEREKNCDGIVRAQCSAHRTGLAIDLVVGHAYGYEVDSSADPNRLYMTRTAAYRWMLANAHRFGFVNYAFEPWHWEWTGESPLPPTP